MTSDRTPTKPTVLVVDDHPWIGAGVESYLETDDEYEFAGQVSTIREALDRVQAGGIDIIIVDISVPGGDGLDLVRQVSSRWPEVLVLILSMHDERVYAERAIRAGARGYLMKSEAPDSLAVALGRIRAGQLFVSDRLQTDINRRVLGGSKSEEVSAIADLTDRELQVFRMLGEGLSPQEIADALSLSIKTVHTYRERIKVKLDVDSATDLLRRAILDVEGHAKGNDEPT